MLAHCVNTVNRKMYKNVLPYEEKRILIFEALRNSTQLLMLLQLQAGDVSLNVPDIVV
jgi:hypothetical protein